MPPDIKLYSDPELMKPHSGDLEILDAGSEKQLSIFCHNEGTGELLDMKAEVISYVPMDPEDPDEPGPLNAKIVNAPPSSLKPGETWEAQIRWQLDSGEKHGSRRAHLKVTGRYIR